MIKRHKTINFQIFGRLCLTFFVLLSAVFVWLAVPAMARTAESPWESQPHVQARLLSGVTAYGSETYEAALELRLSPGWYAYWRMPGDSGLAPEFDWSESHNVHSVAVNWPTPERYVFAEMHSFIYRSSVLLPLSITVEDVAEDSIINLDARIMVCKNICIPQDVELSLMVPAGAGEPSIHAPRIAHAADKVPVKGDLTGLKIEHLIVGPKAMVATTYSKRGYDTLDVFVEAGDVYITGRPDIKVDEDDFRKAMITIPYPEGEDELQSELMSTAITFTVTDGTESIERVFDFSQ